MWPPNSPYARLARTTMASAFHRTIAVIRVQTLSDAFSAQLRRLGAEVEPIRLSPLARWMDCGRIIHYAEAFAIHEKDLQERPEDYAAITRRRMLGGAFIAASEYVKAQQLRTVLCEEYRAALRDVDALITLSSFDLPCRIDDVSDQGLAPDFMQNLWTLALEPRAFTRSHDDDGKLHRLLSFKYLRLRPVT